MAVEIAIIFRLELNLRGTDNTPFEDAQYNCLLQVIAKIKDSKIRGSKEFEIVGHSDVAPLRKTDPRPVIFRGEYRVNIIFIEYFSWE